MTKNKYAIGVIPRPKTQEEIKFNFDALTFLNMLNGMAYEQAVEQAHRDGKDLEELELQEVRE